MFVQVLCVKLLPFSLCFDKKELVIETRERRTGEARVVAGIVCVCVEKKKKHTQHMLFQILCVCVWLYGV